MRIQGFLFVNSDPPYISFDSATEEGCGRYFDTDTINHALVELDAVEKDHKWPKEYQLRFFGEFQTSKLRDLGLLSTQ